MSYKTEFPDFDYEITIPEGWTDDSWHNDVCPKIYNNDKLVIWCDYKDPERREMEGRQFIVSSYIEESYEPIQEFDTFEDAFAFCQSIKE